MRVSLPTAFGLILLLLCPSSATPAANEVHVFYGDIMSVDPAAKTFEIKSGGKTLVFHYTDKTKLGSRMTYARWDKLKAGDGASVTMHVGEGGIGVADDVRVDGYGNLSKTLSLIRARTTTGDIVTGVAVANYVASEPQGEAFSRATMSGQPNAVEGVFVVSVNPDGTVGRVAAAKSFSDPELNERAAVWLRKWRFRPGTVKEVQIPVDYTRLR
ncbi:MAG: energy transducer TonB [Chthoniobacterales bacterium]